MPLAQRRCSALNIEVRFASGGKRKAELTNYMGAMGARM